MATLAVKYRPQQFEDVCGQENIIAILNNQLNEKSFKNCYLFCGGSGLGKTTMARIFAKKLNNKGSIIEIDAASNNGVDDVRKIIEDSKFLPLDGSYKVYILDECHLFSNGAWNAMLKLIEEPPAKTIFMLCTTDPQKIPVTILGRVQRYNFTRISENKVLGRLKYILQQENITTFDDAALQLIIRTSGGGMRDSITLMEKCLGYDKNLTVENITKALGIVSFEMMFNLLFCIQEKDTKKVLSLLENIYEQGNDIKLFIFDFIQFCLDVVKYKLTKDYKMSRLPANYEESAKNLKFTSQEFSEFINNLVKLNAYIKVENNPIVFIKSFFIQETLKI